MSRRIEQNEFSGYAESVTESSKSLPEQNRELDKESRSALEKRRAESLARELPSSDHYVWNRARAELLRAAVDAGYDPDLLELDLPTDKKMIAAGVDWSVNAVEAARARGQNPKEAAEELATLFAKQDVVTETAAMGPFVNLKLNYERFAPDALKQVRELGPTYGSFRDGNPETILIDYSGPNMAKAMTMAHLRSTIIGESMARITEAAGDTAFRVNHLGDWGGNFGKIVFEYQRCLEEKGDAFLEQLHAAPADTLLQLYRDFKKFQKDAKEKPDMKEEADRRQAAADELFRRMEERDPELLGLWSQIKEWTMDAFNPIYDRLRVEFDSLQGESFYEDRMAEVVEEGLAKGVLRRDSNGAVVFPSQPIYDPEVGQVNEQAMQDRDGNPSDEEIVKANGSTLYLTRDLAAIKYRTQELGVDQIYYVVGKEQKDHFKMLFAMAEQLGYVERDQAQHLDFGHLRIGGGKMSSSSGEVVMLGEVLDEAQAAAEELIVSKRQEAEGSKLDRTDLTDEEREGARRVGIAALEFNDLYNGRHKDIEFNPEIARSLEKGSPRVQYAYTRLRSIQRNAEAEGVDINPDAVAVPKDLTSAEKVVIRRLAEYPAIVAAASRKRAPHRVARYVYDLAQESNAFYKDCPVLNQPDEIRDFRLALIAATCQVVENAAKKLHIELPERM